MLCDRFIKVTTEPPQKVALDGQLMGTTPVEIERIPGSLTIFMPFSYMKIHIKLFMINFGTFSGTQKTTPG